MQSDLGSESFLSLKYKFKANLFFFVFLNHTLRVLVSRIHLLHNVQNIALISSCFNTLGHDLSPSQKKEKKKLVLFYERDERLRG